VSEIAERIAQVRERIAEVALGAGRDPASVRLVAVTKGVPVERVREAIAAGAADLGENRAQELVGKMQSVAEASRMHRWHFIGTLQRNKVRFVAGRVALLHSVDSLELGRAVATRAGSLDREQDALLEVNVSGEASKHGIDPDEAAQVVAGLDGLPGIHLRGLMTIAPEGGGNATRTAFAALRALRDRLRGEPGGRDLDELSMGMTSDFEAAIEEGSTIVRVGTAIFGPRP
jgi:pyridoxal phosphate enzyme (YggS family)